MALWGGSNLFNLCKQGPDDQVKVHFTYTACRHFTADSLRETLSRMGQMFLRTLFIATPEKTS
uniref:Uncharacterized protein n=1 Tax=Erwinia amylovora ATCC BAA-2158 TaxID=889211 RepID=E5B1P9_ERWAM|nr:hypothetical protein predicted by Glimmer/Critica [Erwinia amylovora ATCC BAA-2158]